MISNAIVEVKYESSPSTLSNGGTKQLPGDSTGAVRVSGSGTGGSTAPSTSVIGGAVYNTTAPTYTNGQQTQNQADVNGNLKTYEQYAPVYEDNTIGVAKVEQRFSYSRLTADGQVKATAGFVHSLTFSATGTVTAGVITVYDNTAESGTAIWSGTIQTGLNPVTVMLNVTAGTGIYVGYDGTIANVATTVAYR